jgi:Tfp pilus assembly protein PilO
MNLASPVATKVVGGLALLLLAGLGWMFVVGPETTRLSEVRAGIMDTRAQNDTLRLQLATLERQRQELGATRRTAHALAERFPPTADQPGLFEAVTAAAVDAGIGAKGVTTLAPTPPTIGAADPATGVQLEQTTGAQLARQTVSVSVEGTYEQTRRLVENLEQMRRAYLIDAVTLSSGATTGSYTTTVTGAMFLMPPVPVPDLATRTGAEGGTNPETGAGG